MRLNDIFTLTGAELLWPEPPGRQYNALLNREIRVGGGADLMSDVLHFDVAQGLLVTGLINPQVIRTAEMADVAAILIVRGKTPLPETCELARQLDIPILGTQVTMFEACGRLYQAGLPAARRHD
jgi:hypothetical protein